jgi:hypothetical protein
MPITPATARFVTQLVPKIVASASIELSPTYPQFVGRSLGVQQPFIEALENTPHNNHGQSVKQLFFSFL